MIEKLNSMHNVTALLNAIFCIAWHEKHIFQKSQVQLCIEEALTEDKQMLHCMTINIFICCDETFCAFLTTTIIY